jgi:hypothetical protein
MRMMTASPPLIHVSAFGHLLKNNSPSLCPHPAFISLLSKPWWKSNYLACLLCLSTCVLLILLYFNYSNAVKISRLFWITTQCSRVRGPKKLIENKYEISMEFGAPFFSKFIQLSLAIVRLF